MEQQGKLNIALVSPNKFAYSETFIQAQRDFLPFQVHYYTGGWLPLQLENKILRPKSRLELHRRRLLRRLKLEHRPDRVIDLMHSFKEQKIDAVLAQYGPSGEALCSICDALKIPLIIHFHGFDASEEAVIKSKNSYKASFEIAKAVIAVSNVMYNKLRELGCPVEKLHYIPYGPRDAFFDVEPNFETSDFIGIGRFVDKKAPYYTIMAFSKVLAEYPEARLTIGGDGVLYNTCKNLVNHLGLQNSVNLPGVMNTSDFILYLANSIAFVQHSITAIGGDSEGTPVAVLEASAAGLPVISTHHAGIPDVILHEETGLLVNEHDVEGMATAMKRVLKERDFARRLGNSGKKRIKQEFSMGRYIENLTVLIESSVGCRNLKAHR